MSNTNPFSGFSEQSVQFLIDLKHNNNREWFNEHRTEFDSYVMTPAREFVIAMGERLATIRPDIHAVPQTDRSIFRIYRDTRFSKDKSPYKTNLAMWFWEGEGHRMANSGFYFHLEPPNLMLGAGIHTFPKPVLAAYRAAVLDPVSGEALGQAINQVSQIDGCSIGGKHYKRVPRGFDADQERSELLQYNGLYCGIETFIPEALYYPELLDYCMQRYIKMMPIHIWLLTVTQNFTE